MKWEGGYSNVKDDRGGETYKGLSRKANPTWEGWKTIDEVKAGREIKHNEFFPALDESHFLYSMETYWTKYKFSEINSQNVANVCFDFFWGSGQNNTALKVLSIMTGKKFQKWNEVARQAINTLNPAKFIENLLKVRADFYAHLVSVNPSQKKFLKGWTNRLEALAKNAGSFVTSPKGKVFTGLATLFTVLTLGYFLTDSKK